MIKKKCCVVLTIVFLVVAISVRIKLVNTAFPSPEILEKVIGESVETDDFIFRLEKIECRDGALAKKLVPNFIFATDEDGNEYDDTRTRLVLADIYIEKKSDQNKVLDYTRVIFQSGAWGNGIDLWLFKALNPDALISEDKMEKGENKHVILPVTMIDSMFKKGEWKTIEERKYSVVLSLYPNKWVFSN